MTGRTEIEALTGKWDKIIMPTFRILALNSGESFFIITAFRKFCGYFCNSINTEIPMCFSIFFIVLFLEVYKMIDKYFLQNILPSGSI